MGIKHSNGHELSQRQLDAIVPVINAHMGGKISKKKFEGAVEDACREAGCPIPGTERQS